MTRKTRPSTLTAGTDPLHDPVVRAARQAREERLKGYREQSLRLHPWICARCGRAFNQANLHELTVHHKDHNHDHNPADGSNWENLCLYCHDNEHQRQEEFARGFSARGQSAQAATTHNPFANLKALLDPGADPSRSPSE